MKKSFSSLLLCSALLCSSAWAQVAVPADGLLDEIAQESRDKARAAREQKEKEEQVQKRKIVEEQRVQRGEINNRTDVWYSLGVSSAALGSAPTQEIGWRSADSQIGFSVTSISNSEMEGVDTSRYLSCQFQSSYTYPYTYTPYLSSSNYGPYSSDNSCMKNLGEKRKGNTWGLDFKFFFNEKPETFQPFLGLGMYFTDKVLVAQSNLTGKKYLKADSSYYDTDKDVKAYIDYNLEIGAHVRFGRLLVGGSVGTLKRQATIGFSF